MAAGDYHHVSEEVIASLADAITASNMESIALKYLDIDWQTIEELKREGFNRDVLRKWTFRNRGQQQVKVRRLTGQITLKETESIVYVRSFACRYITYYVNFRYSRIYCTGLPTRTAGLIQKQ